MQRLLVLWFLLAGYTDTQSVGGPERYLAEVSTDKPIYRVGEKVYTRVVVLNARDHTPLHDNLRATVKVLGPKGDVVASGNAQSAGGTIGFAWPVSEGLSGGEYTLSFNFSNGMAPAERKIDLRIFRAPRLKSQIEFNRDGFGPGDTVHAKLHTERAEGGIPKGAKVSVSARVDDREVYSGISMVDANGDATTAFTLPTDIERGEGTLAMVIADGGVVETASKTLPILVQTVDLQMFAEGGELLSGVPNRLYVEARTPAKKPADIEAAIVDGADNEVARFKTEHEGRGRVTFTPVTGQSYTLKIVAPAGIKKTFPLQPTRATGALLQAVTDVIAPEQKAEFKIASNTPGDYKLTLRQREKEIASKNITVGSGGWFSWSPGPGKLFDVSVALPDDVDGVLAATLWEGETPLAERLVFRQPAKPLNVTITADPDTLTPGARAKVEVKTTDAKGKPVGAVLGVTVTDESVLEMIEKREQAPRLPVMFFLEPEVKELADARVYLDPKNPKAPLAIDLLLGTQGWRRFALKDLTQFIAQYGDAARRALAIQPLPEPPSVASGAWGQAMGKKAMPVPMPPAAMEPAPVMNAPVREPPRMMEDRKDRAEKKGHAEREQRPAPVAAAPRPMPVAMPAPMAQPAHRAKAEAADMADDKVAMAKPMQGAGGFHGGANGVGVMGRIAAEPAREQILAQPEVAAPNAMVWVREYAHVVRPERQPDDRVDFAETLYWNAAIETDAQSGRATFYFDTSDAVTAFAISVDAFNAAGSLGAGIAQLKSVKPFYLEPKMPLQLTSGDVVKLPLALVNGLHQSLDLTLKAETPKGLTLQLPTQTTVPSGDRLRLIVPLDTTGFTGKGDLSIAASGNGASDKVTRPIDVRPAGFPITVAHGGLLERSAKIEIDVPSTIVPGSLSTSVEVYPTPLANLTQALTRLMQEPNGCFEQTSSTSYPLTMAQQYFTSHQGVDPQIVKRSGEILTNGYRRLTSFECKDKGYEWFGGASPGHEALTAYGLMQFSDMKRAKLSLVDASMVDRTRAWLLSRRDGKGGFQRNQRALDSFGGAPSETTNAYIVWALEEAGEKSLDAESRAIIKNAGSDSYVIALAANVAALNKDPAAKGLMDKLAAAQQNDGSIGGARSTITQSRGEALLVETTAMASLAWLKDSHYGGNVDKAMRYLAGVCEGGRFSSTQATVLALKAIVAYDASRARAKSPGKLQLLVDGKPTGSQLAFTPQTDGTLVLPSLTSLPAGKHVVELAMTGGGVMPYSFALKYNALTPASVQGTRIDLKTTLQDATIEEGKVTEMRVEVSNLSDDMLPTPVAIIGIPGGLEVRHDQLKELVKAGTIATYEVNGREVVLYWRSLKPKQVVSLPISVVAAIPGTYTAPASRAYEYYTDENKRWVDGARVEISPKN